ncbi:MAG: SH3 domain-containing protein [Nitrospirota bacterium]|nr:SH3 domain-containing protein [Nitrospirota bacterium]
MKKTVFGLILIFFLICSGGAADAMCVKTSKANIRLGPGTNYESIWQVYKYMPFEKVGVSVSGNWYAVKDVDGDVNWIHKKLITNGFRCAVVKKESVNVRKGPGTRYPKIYPGPARQYFSFRVLKKKGLWIKVRDELGKIGWIHKKFLWIR